MKMLSFSPFSYVLIFLLGIGTAVGELKDFLIPTHHRKTINAVETDYTDWIEAAVVDSSNNIYVCGSQDDLGVLKMYNVQGELLWQKTFSDQVAACYGMALDPSQNVYIASCKVVNGNCRLNYMSFDHNGNLLQDVVGEIDGGDSDHSTDIIIDYPNVYITGWTERPNYRGIPSLGLYDGFLSKFDVITGAHISSVRFGCATWDQNAEDEDDFIVRGVTIPDALTIDAEKNIYVTGVAFGNFMGQSGFGKKDIFLVKVNGVSGSIVYSKLYGSSENERAHDIKVSNDGDFVYIIGNSEGSFTDFGANGANSGEKDVVFSKIRATDGSLLFHRLFGTPDHDAGASLIKHPQASGKFFITGLTRGNLNGVPSLGGADAFVVEMNDLGDIQRTVLLGSARDDAGLALAVQYKGGLPHLVVGGYNNSFDFEEGQMMLTTIPLESEPGQDTCSTKLALIRKKMGEYVKKHALKRSSSRSVTFIGNAIESATGGKIHPFPATKGKCRATSSPGNQRSTLLRLGFEEIPKATKNGDIAVFSCVRDHANGHIQMLYNKKWYSDYAQKTWAPWSDFSTSKVKYYRYTKCDE